MEVRLEDYDLAVADAPVEEITAKPRARRAKSATSSTPRKRTVRKRSTTPKTPRVRKTSATPARRSRKTLATLAPDTSADERVEMLRMIEASAISAPAAEPVYEREPADESLADVDAPVRDAVIAPAAPALPVEAVVEEIVVEAPAVAPAAPRRRFFRRRILIPLTVAVLAIASSAAAFAFLAAPSASQTLTEAEVEKIVASVGELIVLPTDETPLVASVINAELLRASESFYRHAEDGNILLLYTASGRAILYDRERDIIVNIGTLENPPPTGE